MRITLLLSTFLIANAAFAAAPSGLMDPLTLTSEDNVPAPRWMFGVGEVPKGDSVSAEMANAHQAQLTGDFDVCFKSAESAFAKAKSVQPWIVLTELECAMKMKRSPESTDKLMRAANIVDRNPAWLAMGPATPLLRSAMIRALLQSLDQDIKINRVRAVKTIDRLQDLQPFADEKQRAKILAMAGELALQMQKPMAAKKLVLRSLELEDTDEERARLAVVQKALGDDDSNEQAPERPGVKTPTQNLEASSDEMELVERVTATLKSGDLVAATGDAVKLIHDFPGGTRAKWASDRISEMYWSIADKTDLKSTLAKQEIIKKMLGADSDRLNDWAKTMFSRGQWEDALVCSQKALDGTTGARTTSILELASKSAIATDHFDVARKLFDRLVRQSAGQPAAREALLRSGLLHYRQGEYAQAATELERLLTFPQLGNLELIARYWQWRSLQKTKSESADQVADALMHKAPFSYYGLRARFERNGNVLEWKEQKKKLSVEAWLTDNEKRSYDRAMLLLKAGWLDEAQSELKTLPHPEKAEEKAIRALLWAASGQYNNAAKLANEAWDEKPELRRPPFVEAAFPSEFSAQIAAQAKSRNLDFYMLKGLIKQESGYNVRAVSPSSAYGLMQMIPPTAKEIAQDLHLGPIQIPDDLFIPTKNILMGTYYISKMLNKYQGQVPLALASYNAGPARIDRWLKSRPSLKDLMTTRTSQPDAELWIDEIPYWETSTYVKAILRNILIYRMLDQSRVEIKDPIW